MVDNVEFSDPDWNCAIEQRGQALDVSSSEISWNFSKKLKNISFEILAGVMWVNFSIISTYFAHQLSSLLSQYTVILDFLEKDFFIFKGII